MSDGDSAESALHTILIVDDDPIGREMMRAMLMNQGYRLAFARTGYEALDLAAQLVPDLVLLDVMMSDMDGIEVCRRIRAQSDLAEVPIIMITTLDARDIRLASIEAGADDFVTKPIEFLELRARVRAILRLNRYRRLLLERSQRQRAEEEMLRRNRELSLLNRLIALAATGPKTSADIRTILYEACAALAQVFDLPVARAELLREQAGNYATTVVYQAPGSLDFEPDGRLSSPAMLSASNTPQALAADSDQLPPGMASALIVPIVLPSQALAGMIELPSPEHRAFDGRDLAFARSVALAISQAVEAAHLHDQIQQHVDSLEEIVAQRTLELRAERDRTSAILAALGEAVVVTDAGCIIQYLNPATTRLTGYTSDQLIGMNWCHMQPQQEPRFFDLIQGFVRKGQTWRGEVLGQRSDGTTYDAAMTMAPFFEPDEPEQPAGFVSIQRDITPLKEAERLKDRFISNISHELRTPLSIIALHSGNLETLYERLGDAQRRKLIGEIRTQADQLDLLIGDVLEITRIDSGRLTTYSQALDLAMLLQSEAEHQRPLALKKELLFEVITDHSVPIRGDERQLRQVIRNLINNAIKYTPAGGHITAVCTELCETNGTNPEWPGSTQLPPGLWAALSVSDTGIGIEAEHLPHLFERFYRVHNQVMVPGTGLGLAITHELVTRHGGVAGVASTPGRGSTFAVYFPLC